MMKKFILTIVFISGIFSLKAQTADAFQVIKKEQVPVSVIEAFEKSNAYESAPEWRVHLNIYEVKNGNAYFRYNENGALTEKRIQLDWEKDAPKALKDGKNKTYYKFWDVTEFYKADGDTGIYYILQVTEKETNELATIYFDETGKLNTKSNTGY